MRVLIIPAQQAPFVTSQDAPVAVLVHTSQVGGAPILAHEDRDSDELNQNLAVLQALGLPLMMHGNVIVTGPDGSDVPEEAVAVAQRMAAERYRTAVAPKRTAGVGARQDFEIFLNTANSPSTAPARDVLPQLSQMAVDDELDCMLPTETKAWALSQARHLLLRYTLRGESAELMGALAGNVLELLDLAIRRADSGEEDDFVRLAHDLAQALIDQR